MSQNHLDFSLDYINHILVDHSDSIERKNLSQKINQHPPFFMTNYSLGHLHLTILHLITIPVALGCLDHQCFKVL